jgi:hypothetical protein
MIRRTGTTANLHDLEVLVLLPRIRLKTSPTDFYLIHSVRLGALDAVRGPDFTRRRVSRPLPR